MGVALLYSGYHIHQLNTQIADLQYQVEQYRQALDSMREIENKSGEIANAARGSKVEESAIELESLADAALYELTGEKQHP